RGGRRVHLGGDVAGEVGVLVDAGQARADRGEGVRRLPADALAGPEHEEATTVEAQETGVVGDGGLVGAGHGAPTCAPTVATSPACHRSGTSISYTRSRFTTALLMVSADGRRRYLASPPRPGGRSSAGIDRVSYGLGRRRRRRSLDAA